MMDTHIIVIKSETTTKVQDFTCIKCIPQRYDTKPLRYNSGWHHVYAHLNAGHTRKSTHINVVDAI